MIAKLNWQIRSDTFEMAKYCCLDSGSTLKKRCLYSAMYILGGIPGPDIHMEKGMAKLIVNPNDSLGNIASYPC